MLIEEKREFDADPDLVWKRVSDVRSMPDYWHGTKSLEVVRNEGDRVFAKVRFAFGGSGEVEVSMDSAARKLVLNYVSGPFTGNQTVTVSGRTIQARWDIKFRGIFKLASSWNEGHFRSGTVHALERLTNPH